MDNKNEKTFADLFSSASLSDDDSTNTNTEQSILDKVEDEEINNNIDNTFLFNDISVDTNSVDEDSKESVDKITLDNLFNESINDESTNSVSEENKDNNVNNDINLENDMSINIQNNDELVEKLDDSNLFFSQDAEINNNENKEEININDVFFDEKREKLKDNESNFENEIVNEDNKEETEFVSIFDERKNLEIEKNLNDNIITETLNKNNNLEIERQVEVNNEVDEKSLSINELVEKKKQEKESDFKEESSSNSPFFQEDSLEKEDFGIGVLENNNITFDQTKNVNSNLEKIDFSKSKHFNVKLVQPKTSLTKFVIGVVSYAFFIFLVLILVTLLTYVLDIKIRAAKGDYSSPTFNAYVVLTGSMLPEIQVKDVVVTKKVDASELEKGDIITFASSDSRFLGTIITHRIIKKNQDKDGNITFQTQGDNNNVADSALVQPNNIYGKVILKIPKLGYLQDFLATQGGWIIVILLPCMAVISYDIVKITKGLKRKKNKIKVIK